MANPFFDPVGTGETSQMLGLAAIAAHKEKADRALARLVEINATIEEVTFSLEEELRDLRYELHTIGHNEPDDVDSRAYARWKERQDLLERHIADVEAEIEEIKEAVRNGEYEV